MLALTLTKSPSPTPQGSRASCLGFAGITTLPSATFSMSQAVSTCSFSATFFISGVVTPDLAIFN
jgi:hypothetical protein